MINWARILELCDEFGADDFGEVVELFLEEVENGIEQLKAERGNQTLIGENMHFLKGAALNLGFQALAELCQAAESSAKSGGVMPVHIDAVADCFFASRMVFEKELDARIAA